MPKKRYKIPFLDTEMEFEFTSIRRDEIPRTVQVDHASKWDKILDPFLAHDSEVVRLDFDWPEGTTNGQAEGIYSGLRARINKRQLEIDCIRRSGEIFLVKRRPEDYQYVATEEVPNA